MSLTTDSEGQAYTTYFPSGRIEDVGIYAHLFESGPDVNTPGNPIPTVYSAKNVINDTLTLDSSVYSSANELFLFKIYDNIDPFNTYNNETRVGGHLIVYYQYNPISGDNELIRPIAANNKVLVFDHSLPQSHNPAAPNYDSDLRGFIVISKKQVVVQAWTEYRGNRINSNADALIVKYSPIQTGTWTLPIPPGEYDGSAISRATWLILNP